MERDRVDPAVFGLGRGRLDAEHHDELGRAPATATA